MPSFGPPPKHHNPYLVLCIDFPHDGFARGNAVAWDFGILGIETLGGIKSIEAAGEHFFLPSGMGCFHASKLDVIGRLLSITRSQRSTGVSRQHLLDLSIRTPSKLKSSTEDTEPNLVPW